MKFAEVMYSIDYTTRFKKDLKRCRKRGLDIQMILDAIALLRTTGSLPAEYHPHPLKARIKGSRGWANKLSWIPVKHELP